MKKQNKKLTILPRSVIYLVGVAALAVCFILIPELVREEGVGKPFNPYLFYAFFGGVYLLAAPFFVALYQTHKLLNYVDQGKAFSRESVSVLRNIKRCSVVFGVLLITALVLLVSISRAIDPTEDITGFITLGVLFTSASFVMTVFIAVLQKLLEDAVSLKSENDLII